MDRTFQGIDFRCAARYARTGVIFACAGAGRQPHSRQKAETIIGTLVRCDTHVALIVVTVWPQSLGGTKITRTSQVAHCPETRPETTDIAATGQRNTSIEESALVAKLVPGLDHTRSIVQAVVLESTEL